MENLLQEAAAHPALTWLIVGVLFALVEITSPTFGFIFASLSALIVSGLASSVPGWEWQLLIFGVLLLLSLAVLRPPLLARLHNRQSMPSRADALIGKSGRLTEAVGPDLGLGRVLIEDQDWAARSRVPLERGALVSIQSVDGIVLNVIKKEDRHV